MKDLFMTVKEVAICLKVNEKTVYRWARTIPGYQKLGGSILFNRQTFLRYTEGHKPQPTVRGRGSYMGNSNPHNL